MKRNYESQVTNLKRPDGQMLFIKIVEVDLQPFFLEFGWGGLHLYPGEELWCGRIKSDQHLLPEHMAVSPFEVPTPCRCTYGSLTGAWLFM